MNHLQTLGWAVMNSDVRLSMDCKWGLGLRGLLGFGGEVDIKCNDGTCLLQTAVRYADPCVILDILYHNPSAVFVQSSNNSLLEDAILRDVSLTHKYTGSISLLLLDCGYNVREDSDIRSKCLLLLSPMEKEQPNLRRKIIERIGAELFCPKSLLVLCKDELRKGFPGLALHKLVNHTLSRPLKDFVLMETRLKQRIGQCVMDGNCVMKP